MVEILILLIAAHFICDFLFQTNDIAIGKDPTRDRYHLNIPWGYWMTTHALTHGVAVFLITQNIHLLILETVVHGYIDYFKCKKIYYIHTDQLLHIACKVLWVFLLIWNIV